MMYFKPGTHYDVTNMKVLDMARIRVWYGFITLWSGRTEGAALVQSLLRDVTTRLSPDIFAFAFVV